MGVSAGGAGGVDTVQSVRDTSDGAGEGRPGRMSEVSPGATPSFRAGACAARTRACRLTRRRPPPGGGGTSWKCLEEGVDQGRGRKGTACAHGDGGRSGRRRVPRGRFWRVWCGRGKARRRQAPPVEPPASSRGCQVAELLNAAIDGSGEVDDARSTVSLGRHRPILLGREQRQEEVRWGFGAGSCFTHGFGQE